MPIQSTLATCRVPRFWSGLVRKLSGAGWLLVALIAFTLTGCAPSRGFDTRPCGTADFAIYLLAEDMKPDELLAADPGAVKLGDRPLLAHGDIVSYDAEIHEIRLTAEAYRRVQDLYTLPVDTDGLAFAVCAGGDPVYLGAFWTPLSSLSFDGVVIMQPIAMETDTIRIELGYPGPDMVTIADPRSDPRVLQALTRAGKLRK